MLQFQNELSVERWPLDRLIPYARNARTHSEAQIAQIAASIAEFDFLNPVLVDPEGGIIAGHGRVLAARKLRLPEVPVIVLRHLTENQKRAFMLADNKIALHAGWDEEMLRLELQALADADMALALTGFEEEELRTLLEADRCAGLTEPDLAPAAATDPVSASGDVWTLGDHRLLCGDGTRVEDLRRVLGENACDLVFTDLPYNVDYEGKTARKLRLANDNLGSAFGSFLRQACGAMLTVCGGAIYVCMSSSELARLHGAFEECGAHWSTYIVWAKNTFTLGRSDYQRQYEPIWYGWRAGSQHYWCGDRSQGDVWLINKPHRNDLHPTMKPVELVERAIANSSRSGDTVLDPFAGAGSTVIACQNLGRLARVIEIDPRYADVIIERWQNYTGHQARLAAEGTTFEQVRTSRTQRAEPEERAA